MLGHKACTFPSEDDSIVIVFLMTNYEHDKLTLISIKMHRNSLKRKDVDMEIYSHVEDL